MKLFTKELFIETINALEKQFKHDDKSADYLSKVFDTFGMGLYDNTLLTNQLFKILDTEFHKNNDIEYFCYDLDFGKKWKPGMVIDENGGNIKLETTEDLWNELTRK